VLPPGVSHGFQRTTNRAPLCLTIDFAAEESDCIEWPYAA